MNYLQLGASLYVPAITHNLLQIANGESFQLRSVIFCTEDSIHSEQVEQAIANLEEALPNFKPVSILRFIRVREPYVMKRLLSVEGIKNVDGFVIPKATRKNLPKYLDLMSDCAHYAIMPTLETSDVFDAIEMKKLRQFLSSEKVRPRILSLRIGGNDLLNLLSLRRSCTQTIYDSPLREVISLLVGTFKTYGFNLTAPVFEGLAHADVLRKEVELDLAYGLFGKTAIHPRQVSLIESAYAVKAEELRMAFRMLSDDAPALFKMNDTMCEVATHRKWASMVIQRSEIYGVVGEAED